MEWLILNLTFAHGFAVVPVGIVGVHAFNGSWTLVHDEAWRAAEGDGGAQLVANVTAGKISIRHEWLPAVFIVESYEEREKKSNCGQEVKNPSF